MLAAVWPADMPAPLWQRRAGADPITDHDLIWDMTGVAPDVPRHVSAVIVLAGVTGGARLADNTTLAQAGADLAGRLGVKTLVASSQAVYGHAAGVLRTTDTIIPSNAYGQAKRDMEVALQNCADVTCLRIGNVAGCDGLFGAMARGPVTIDQFADGQSPRRMMIGPADLAGVLGQLATTQTPLPRLMNIAAPGLVAMDALADAAGVTWGWQPAPDTALPVLEMDVTPMLAHINLPPARADDLVAQARAGGWQAQP